MHLPAQQGNQQQKPAWMGSLLLEGHPGSALPPVAVKPQSLTLLLVLHCFADDSEPRLPPVSTSRGAVGTEEVHLQPAGCPGKYQGVCNFFINEQLAIPWEWALTGSKCSHPQLSLWLIGHAAECQD
jgi:hypothetical protein